MIGDVLCSWWMKDCEHDGLDQNIQFYFEEGVRVFMRKSYTVKSYPEIYHSHNTAHTKIR